MIQVKEKKNIPELRFPEFSREWKREILKNNISEYKESSQVQDQFSVFTSSRNGLVFQNEYFKKGNRYSTRNNIGFNILPENYITYRSRSDDGKFYFNKNVLGETGIISIYYPVFTSTNADIDFLLNTLNLNWKEFFKNSVGTSQKVLSLTELKKIKVNLPQKEEQKKIAEFLGLVDVWIENLEEQKAHWENYKKGMMQKLFPAKDQNVPELRFKDKNGNDFPAWKEKRLGDVGSFRSGIGFSEREQGGKIGIPFFKVSDMNLPGNEYEMSCANNYVSQEQMEDLKYTIFEKPSIIFAKVGAAIFLERKRIAENFLIDNNMMAFTPDKSIIFYKYLFEKIILSKYAQIGALPSYGASDLKSIKIQLPSISEQKKIADFLSAIDDVITGKDQEITTAREWKKGLMQKMFV